MMSKEMRPLKEYTKFPLLRGWMLQRPELSGIGFATAFAMLV